MRVAVFFERDGILARSASGNGTAVNLEDFRVCEDAVAPLRRLREAGFFLFATTNQPGITSNAPDWRELDRMHAVLVRRLGLDDVLVCPHEPDDQCPCRKPQPGLLLEAARRHGVDLDHSFVVSERWVDAEMADAAGATSVLIRSELNGKGHHDFVVPDLDAAVTKILEIAEELGTLRVMCHRNVAMEPPAAPSAARDHRNGSPSGGAPSRGAAPRKTASKRATRKPRST